MGIEGKSKGAGHQKMIHPGSVRIRAYSGDCAEQRLCLVLRRNAVRVHCVLFSAGKRSFRWNRVQTRPISFYRCFLARMVIWADFAASGQRLAARVFRFGLVGTAITLSPSGNPFRL